MDVRQVAYVHIIVDSADKVAHRELKALMNHERSLLNASVLDALFKYSQDVVWVYRAMSSILILRPALINSYLVYVMRFISHLYTSMTE